MNELISVKNENGELLVSARELHKGLELSRRFSLWIEQYINKENKYGFEEGYDFTSVLSSTVVNNGASRQLQDYGIKLDMAKEICMITANEKGKQFRKYFIECERKLKQVNNQPQLPTTYKEALQQLLIQVEENEKLQVEVTQKQTIIDNVIDDDGLFAVGTVGKVLKPYCNNMGSIKIFKFLRENNILMDNERTQKHNLPYDRYNKYFELKYIETTFGTHVKPYFNGKGLKWFLNRLVKEGYLTSEQREEVKNKF